MKQMEELYKKREREHLDTIAVMQKRIEDLEGAAGESKDMSDGEEQIEESVDSDEDADVSDGGKDLDESGPKITKEIVSGSNLQWIHERYQAVLDILVKKKCSLTEAMRRFGIPRNTLRDYVGICELHIIDIERYHKVVDAERQRSGKVSVKSIEKRCRVALSEYRVQANKLKQEKKLLPFFPNEDFYTQK
ncbi:hypothetical protein ACROYT_G001634 [Oculina patagonica]